MRFFSRSFGPIVVGPGYKVARDSSIKKNLHKAYIMARTKKVTFDTIVVVGVSKGLQGYLHFNRNR